MTPRAARPPSRPSPPPDASHLLVTFILTSLPIPILVEHMSVEEEVALLQEKIKELGSEQADGRIGVEFGVLFDATQDVFEALNGTLRAAKREKKVAFEGTHLSYAVETLYNTILHMR